MNKTLYIARNVAFGAAIFSLAACGSADAPAEADSANENQTFYGSVIELDGATDADGLREALAENGRAQVRFEGEVTATCAKKGCWMDVASGEDTVFVRFQDYGFFVPTEGAEGKRTVMEGEAFFDTITVEMRKHYAEDAGESEEVIAAITEPELRLAFTATGVMIED
jgi:ABC-type phosphate transport system substrate-binding protein